MANFLSFDGLEYYHDKLIAKINSLLGGKANSSHKHSASDINSGTLPIARGGTGGSTEATARTALGVYSTSEVDSKLNGKSDTNHNHNSLYDAKGSANSALTSAKAYTDSKLEEAGEGWETIIGVMYGDDWDGNSVPSSIRDIANQEANTALASAKSYTDNKASALTTSLTNHTGSTNNPHNVTKEQLGLANVENKSSATIRSEITSSNVTTALGYTPVNPSAIGNSIAQLDSNGKVPSSQLPSYVDDVLEYAAKANFPVTGETGKIYVDKTTNKTYRWGGSSYVEISESLALGVTSSTAYPGDQGKATTEALNSHLSASNPHGISVNSLGAAKASDLSSHLSASNPHNITTDTIGAAKASHGTHVTFSSAAPLGNSSSASAGSATTVARSDHQHPLQTNVSGNAGSADKLTKNGGSSTKPVYFSNGVPVEIGYTIEKNVPSDAVFTDTHYTTGLKVGKSADATANQAASNGSVYLNILDNSTVRESHLIVGSGGTSVTSDNNGKITINSSSYGVATDSTPGLVKSGTDITVDTNGNVSIKDNSHSHTINNITDLQTTLNGKANSNTVYTKTEIDSSIKTLSDSITLNTSSINALTTAINSLQKITPTDIDGLNWTWNSN